MKRDLTRRQAVLGATALMADLTAPYTAMSL
jgi:hypothetical protein